MLKAIGYHILYYSGIPGFRRASRTRPYGIILAYHRVAPHADDNYILKDMLVKPEDFDNQISFLKKNYRVVPLDSFVDNIRSSNASSCERIAITFDDAYADNYDYAFVILKKQSVPATVFIPSAFIETGKSFWWDVLADMLNRTQKHELMFTYYGINYNIKLRNSALKKKAFNTLLSMVKYLDDKEQQSLLALLGECLEVKHPTHASHLLSWSQIKEMSDYGVTFGAHTHSHSPLSHLSIGEIEEELHKPKEILESRLGRRINDFAYPYGEEPDFNIPVSNAVAKAGYTCALTMIQEVIHSDENLFSLPRIGIGGNDTKESFQLKLGGLIPLWRRKKYAKMTYKNAESQT